MEDRYLCKARPIGTRKQWVTGFYAVLGEKTVIIVNEPEKFYDVDSEKNSHGNKIVEVIPKTVCQCTGLKDKNGKLIWENDICDRKEQYPEIVEYRNGDWTLDYSYASYKESGVCYCNLGFYTEERKCVEVIGNIFDNPELLEVHNDGE